MSRDWRSQKFALRERPACCVELPGSDGFHWVRRRQVRLECQALRGPIRRSYIGAICMRQLLAASARSALDISTSTSFSASANVTGDTYWAYRRASQRPVEPRRQFRTLPRWRLRMGVDGCAEQSDGA